MSDPDDDNFIPSLSTFQMPTEIAPITRPMANVTLEAVEIDWDEVERRPKDDVWARLMLAIRDGTWVKMP